MSRFKIIASISLVILACGEIYLNQKINHLNLQPQTFLQSTPSPILFPSPSSSPIALSSPTVSSAPSIKPTTIPTVNFQPQLVYLGSASTSQTDWTETDVEVSLNSNDYPSDVSAVFEAGLSIVNGEVWARLKNKTSGAIMSVTEIYNNTNSAVWKTSPTFKLFAGNNVYVVEIKSSSSEMAKMSGARIKISR